MNILILMAGRGNRFKTAGYNDPKSLINIDGKPMIEHVINMFSPKDTFTFVCDKTDIESTKMRGVLENIVKKPQIVIDKSKSKLGPVFSARFAFKELSNSDPVIVCYCDFYEFWDYNNFKKTVRKVNCDAAVTAYKGFHPHLLGQNLYASMLVNREGFMIECREKYSFTKNKVDCFHQSGKFYFKSGLLLKNYFSEVIRNKLTVNNEYYVSVVTQLMKEAGLSIFVYPVKYFLQWGTPEDLAEYTFWLSNFKSGLSINQIKDKRIFDYWKSFFKESV